jgi:hypothetical protein
MPVYTEALPATKSSRINTIHWTPSETVPHAGFLKIDTGRGRVPYFVVEIPHDRNGVRAFHFAKLADSPGTDAEAEDYTVEVGAAGQSSLCQCKGFLRWKTPCKHVAAAVAILDNGWLDSPVNPDADTENTEAPF